MSITCQNLLRNSNSRVSFYFADANVIPLKNPNLFLSSSFKPIRNLIRLQILSNPISSRPLRNHGSRIQVFQSEGAVQRKSGRNNLHLDSILSVVEFICLASSAIVSVGLAVNSVVSNPQKSMMVALGNRIFLWQAVALVGGVVVGSWIRRRQWRRICKDTAGKTGNESVNLVERMEKMEEDIRGLATIIQVMSRQLEKLGIRFRVTRKALKEPILETAALAQKNSEATRALAVQEDILEKELGEIQKVLIAMQEQQRKQLELILAIGKTGKLWENNRGQSKEGAIETSDSSEVEQMKAHKIAAAARQKGANNDRA